ncbi:MAG: penicillin-binding transpeptidase domain-containing protein [Pseudomonadota bacterium]
MDRVHFKRSLKPRLKTFSLKVLCGIGLAVIALTSKAAADATDIGPSVAAAGGIVESTTIAVKRLSDGQLWIANPDRAELKVSPASTSKIPHSLIALENRLVTPETILQWDGIPRSNRAWNQNHTLQSAFQNSVVWVYQEIARTAGQTVMSDGLKRLDYGNATVGTIDQLTTYWLDDTLSISALEQIEFLTKLALERLPLSKATYATARDIMISDAGADWTMRSKTGWRYNKTDMDIGWFVGWLECGHETHVFALNMDMPDTRSLSKRKSVTYQVLQEIGAFDCS